MNTGRFGMAVCALLCAGLWSCGVGTTAAFDALPDATRAAYDRCWEHMVVPICGANGEIADVLTCARLSSGTYAAQDSDAERRAWLTAHGCPRGVASSGGP